MVTEIKNKRTQKSKTFDIGSEKRRAVISSTPQHYWSEDGWKEIQFEYIRSSENFVYPHLKKKYTIPKETSDGIIVYDKYIGESIIIIPEVTIDGSISHSEFTSVIENENKHRFVFSNYDGGRLFIDVSQSSVEILYEIAKPENIPENISLNIVGECELEVSNTEKNILNTIDNVEKINHRPINVDIVFDSYDFWRVDKPIFKADNGREISSSYDVSNGNISINLVDDLNSAEYPVVLDPTFTDSTNVSDNDNTNYSIPTDIKIESSEVRWSGVEENSFTYYRNKKTIDSESEATTYTTVPYPSSGSPDSARANLGTSNAGAPDIEVSIISNKSSSTPSIEDWQTDRVSFGGEDYAGSKYISGGEGPLEVEGNDTHLHVKWRNLNQYINYGTSRSYVEASTESSTTIKTENPSVTCDETNDTVSYNGTVEDYEETSWQSIEIQKGDITFSHGIDGSEKAEFYFTYTYTEKPSAPSNLGLTLQ